MANPDKLLKKIDSATNKLGKAVLNWQAAISAWKTKPVVNGARKVVAKATAPKADRMARRDNDSIEKAKLRLVEYIRKNPGVRVEQIKKELGVSTKELALPLRKLVSEGVLRTEGLKRATSYHPAK
jgi:predicted HTH transcriptional regulator